MIETFFSYEGSIPVTMIPGHLSSLKWWMTLSKTCQAISMHRTGPLPMVICSSAIQMEKAMVSLLLFLIVLVAAFNIVSSLVMVVTDKKSDIAILRTLGASPATITRIFYGAGNHHWGDWYGVWCHSRDYFLLQVSVV